MTRMDRPELPADPRGRMGIYKSLADVPDRYRLKFRGDAYANRDVWAEFLDAQTEHYDSPTFLKKSRRAGAYWMAHMEEQGRHHALATPDDVETFVDSLLEDRAVSTVYHPYWTRLEAFYDWLQWHPAHPHRYHPVLMAAADGEAAGRVWQFKLTRNRNRTPTE